MSLIGSLFELIRLVTGLWPNPGYRTGCGRFVDANRFLGGFEKQNPKPRKHKSRAVRGFEFGGPSRTRTYDQGIMSRY